MKTRNRIATLIAAGLIAFTAASPAMADRETRNTLLGAGAGGVAGALLSNGDPWVTVGGAAAGGLIGNIATSDHHSHDRGHRYERRRSHGWHGHNSHSRYRGHHYRGHHR